MVSTIKNGKEKKSGSSQNQPLWHCVRQNKCVYMRGTYLMQKKGIEASM